MTIATKTQTDRNKTFGHFSDNSNNSTVTTYIRNIHNMSISTAKEYRRRLNNFKDFIATEYNSHLSINDLIAKIKQGEEDPYDILNSYAAYLRNCDISNITIKQRVVTVKNFLEYYDVDLSP
ncbi:MAG TPA: hypothetical protein VFJ51_01805, partial [Nitrososphaeraceae archaeon]|nr:hypothetical protein [Nitrososphaeraceae archaeon]